MQFNHIANAAVPCASGRTLPVTDPSDGQPFDEIQRSHAQDIDAAVSAARDAHDGVWRRLGAAERARLLTRLSDLVAAHADELAVLGQRDGGKPVRLAMADTLALVRSLAFHASACDQLRAETLPDQNGYSVSTWREPHGVTGHLLPWKNPLRTFGRSVGGALAAGNVCVVKPAEDASLALLRVAELAAEAGFPPGVVNIVTGYGHEAGDALARHRGIGHISFTGSPKTGTLVQQVAAERHCPVTLTLGGHSPQIVFADADLDRAVPALIGAMLYNAGQTGAAGARVLIAQTIYEPLLDRLGAAFEALRVGPAGMDLHMGPLIRQSQQQRVWDFLSDAHVAGIAMVAQGVVVDEAPESGFYQAPTLLRDVPLLQAMALETVPGPVLAATPFADEDHAVALANAAPHTSMAHLWTRDAPRQLRLAQGLRCGRVAVNDHGGEEREGGFSPWAVPGPAESLDAVLAFTTLKTLAVRGI